MLPAILPEFADYPQPLHALSNFYREASQQLRGRPCEAYISNMRVKVSHMGVYTYPDVVVVCGEIRFEDVDNDTLLNPTIIVEVRSASTEAHDRGEKFAHYRWLESLQEYLLVAQDKVRTEHYVGQGAQWVLSEASTLDEMVHLAAIDGDVVLRDVYDGVGRSGLPIGTVWAFFQSQEFEQ